MKMNEHVYLVGSGLMGMNQTDTFDCNVYLLDSGRDYVLFDGGAGRNPQAIIDEMVRDGLDPQKIAYIVATHAHADHSGGIHAIQKITDAVVLGSQETARILVEQDEESIQLTTAKHVGIYPQDYKWHGCQQVKAIKGGQSLTVGSFTLEWIATPGHSSDMISCYVKELKAMFSSDVIFAGGKIAALSTPDFSMTDLASSVAALTKYEVDRLFPGHLCPVLREGGSTIKLAHDIFTRLNVPASIV